jgi:Dual specificity phosphatase, catalytic domain.
MIEIHPNLFIGNEYDYESRVRNEPGWCVVHACKEPYHREALGYSGKAAPKNHPKYLIARRGNRLILNLVDAPDPAFIPNEIIDAALEFISTSLHAGNRVLVHCNEGCSRSAGIGLLYLAKNTDNVPKDNFLAAEAVFRSIYPPYTPKSGMRGFMMSNWCNYC